MSRRGIRIPCDSDPANKIFDKSANICYVTAALMVGLISVLFETLLIWEEMER